MGIHDADKQAFNQNGFAILNGIFSIEEVNTIIALTEHSVYDKPAFRRTKDLFAIRRFLQEIPAVVECLFTARFSRILEQYFGKGCFVTKSIYFDKPPTSNWFVSYHQDLTIAVDRKITLEGFGSWTMKQDYFATQPPVGILQNNSTVRIHLDDTDVNNGALKVISASHTKGIVRPETLNLALEKETICEVKKGGIMLMKPLLLHASGRSVSACRRRVVHIEFSKSTLPAPLQWTEYMSIKTPG